MRKLGLCIGFIIGMVLGAFIFNFGGHIKIEQLGKSICEEEYDLDFESYYDGVLKCKPFKESYDGIKVEINNNGV